jgi:hypothetical protein
VFVGSRIRSCFGEPTKAGEAAFLLFVFAAKDEEEEVSTGLGGDCNTDDKPIPRGSRGPNPPVGSEAIEGLMKGTDEASAEDRFLDV